MQVHGEPHAMNAKPHRHGVGELKARARKSKSGKATGSLAWSAATMAMAISPSATEMAQAVPRPGGGCMTCMRVTFGLRVTTTLARLAKRGDELMRMDLSLSLALQVH